MEVGPHQDPSRLQRVSHRSCTTIVIISHLQTELAINTHTTVSGTHTVVSNTHTMVTDIHRTIVHGQEGNGGQFSVSCIPAISE